MLAACLPSRRRRQLVFLFGLMLLGAVAEVLSLGAIVPFLAILADPAQALERPIVGHLVSMFGVGIEQDVRWQFTLMFAATAVVSGVVRFVLIYAMAKVNYGIGHELGAEVYRRTLYQPYEVQVARNSSEIMGGINKVDVVVWLIANVLYILSAAIMAIFMVAALVAIDPPVAIAALLGFSSIYAIVSVVTRKRLARNSEIISSTIDLRVQSVQEGLGGIRDVLLDHSQELYARRFSQIDWPLRQAQASNNIIGPSPRFAVEALGMVLISLLGYSMTASGGGVAAALPTLGALALGAQRLMPLLQLSYQGCVLVAGNRQVLDDVVALLHQPVSHDAKDQITHLPFFDCIRFQNVAFSYQQHLPSVVRDLTLSIPKGGRVGFIGTTGSGKSTLMDLLMGLLLPTSGQIVVDGTPLNSATRLRWQRNVAHVPQAIFLADVSFAENIAFGVDADQIDMVRVRQAAQHAQIAQFIESSAQGYEALVGERGVRLSGGQRQRIGIARALYKQATVLIFDEATSSLDTETEQAVMQAIESLDKELTIVLIAHRLTTLKNCTKIVDLEGGEIKRIGTYEEMVDQSA
jgi:ATP-binding cassette subfamily B protein